MKYGNVIIKEFGAKKEAKENIILPKKEVARLVNYVGGAFLITSVISFVLGIVIGKIFL